MRKHDWRRHQLRGFIAGEPEHQPLVAGALFRMAFAFGLGRIYALGDIRALTGNNVLNPDFICMKDVVVVDVSDLAHGITDDLIDRHHGFKRSPLGQVWDGDLAADDNGIALGKGFAGDAAGSIATEAGVENGIRNGIADLVGMAFTDGLGRENETTEHGMMAA